MEALARRGREEKGRRVTSIEDELEEYFAKFPRRIAKSYNLTCDQCDYNIGVLGLTVGEICEGCNYSILTDRQGRRFVARKHVDHMYELFRHESMQNCHDAKTE